MTSIPSSDLYRELEVDPAASAETIRCGVEGVAQAASSRRRRFGPGPGARETDQPPTTGWRTRLGAPCTIGSADGHSWSPLPLPARYNTLVYTGPVDEFFGRRFGPLPYRSLEFKFETLDVPWHQSTGTVNEPDENVPHTRTTEFKHLTGQAAPGTTLVHEFPRAEGDPHYPIPWKQNEDLYGRYRLLADASPDVPFVGRPATYRYYNMDQAVAQALTTFKRMAGDLGPIPEPLCGANDGTSPLASAPAGGEVFDTRP